jgi:hypothetical protein
VLTNIPSAVISDENASSVAAAQASTASSSDDLGRPEWCCDGCRQPLPRFARLQTLHGWGFG